MTVLGGFMEGVKIGTGVSPYLRNPTTTRLWKKRSERR